MSRGCVCALVLVFVLLNAAPGALMGPAPHGGQYPNKIALLTQGFIVAWLCALVWVTCSRANAAGSSTVPASAWPKLAGLVLTASVGIPAYFLAFTYEGTVLTFPQVTFIDYTLVPVFVALVARCIEGRFGVQTGVEACGMGISLLGSVLLVASAFALEPTAGSDPTPNLGAELAIGLLLTATTSLCGAASLHFGRRLRELPTSVIVHAKFAGAAAAMLFYCLSAQAGTALLQWQGYGWSLAMGGLMFAPLAIVYFVLKCEVVTLLVPYLFLVPVASFLLSWLTSSDPEMLARVQPLEWAGMCVITVGFVLAALPAHKSSTPAPV